jgi:hypothetical protein
MYVFNRPGAIPGRFFQTEVLAAARRVPECDGKNLPMGVAFALG